MRVLMISDVYFPRVNGVSTSIMTVRRELARAGHAVTLIAPDYGVLTDDESGILRVPSRKVWLDPEDRMMAMRHVLARAAQLEREAFDLIHIHTPFVAHYAGFRLARRFGVPVVESYHTFFEEYLFHYVPLVPKGVMRYLARAFSRSQCAALDGLIVPSHPMLEVLRRYGIDTRAQVIPTGIELAAFQGGDGLAFRARHGIAAHRPLLLFVGRVAHEKNIGFLLEVMVKVRQAVPEALLVIAGEGPAAPALKRQSQALGLDGAVRFVGYLDRATELLDCYRAADLFVFSSRTETQGLVLLEAMALGVPVVGLAVMGTAEVLQPGRGAWIAEDDIDDFAAKVVTLLRDSEARGALGRAARAYAATWSAPEMTRRLVAFYEVVVAAHARNPDLAHVRA